MALKFVRAEPVLPGELERFRLDEEDAQWLAEHAAEIEQQHRGKYIAVVNKQLFVGESFEEAQDLGRRARPGREPIVEYVPIKSRILVV